MKRIILAIVLVLWAGISEAATYYVSTSGDDASAGSEVAPWKSIWKVNNTTLAAGDNVYFKRGDVWENANSVQLVPSASGTAVGGYITFGAYGTGNKPQLQHSSERNSASDWTDETGNIWSTSGTTTSGTELLANPTFTTNASGWYVNYSGGASGANDLTRTTTAGEYDSATAGGKFAVTNGGSSNAHVQLLDSTGNRVSIVAGTYYRLTFAAKASADFTIPAINLLDASNTTAYSQKVGNQTPAITSSFQTFNIYFRASKTDASGRVIFYMGGAIPNGTTFYLDSVSFQALADPSFLIADIGGVVQSNGTFIEPKVATSGELDTQGEWWYDSTNFKLKMYSVGNPATVYGGDLILLNGVYQFSNENKDYITIENIAFRFSGYNAVRNGSGVDYLTVQDCDFEYIGGTPTTPGNMALRMGAGISSWCNGSNYTIQRNYFNQVFTTSMVNECGDAIALTKDTYNFRYNLVKNTEYGYEVSDTGSTSGNYQNLYIYNNTFVDIGRGWGHTQLNDAVTFMAWRINATKTNLNFKNNISYNSTSVTGNQSIFRFHQNSTTPANFTINNNVYYNTSGGNFAVLTYTPTTYSMAQFADWKTATSQDASSQVADPLFNAGAYTLQAGSPAKGTGTPISGIHNVSTCTDMAGNSCYKGGTVTIAP